MQSVEELLNDLIAGPDADTLLFGVRHHSPACARAVVAAAQEWQPEAIAIELPTDLDELVPIIADPRTEAPVAVAIAGGQGTGFYPFADFSPELAILRWAQAQNIPVHCIDLPAGAEILEDEIPEEGPTIDVEQLVGQESWDTQVEARAVGQTWQQVRRAALGVGLGVRLAEHIPDAKTRAREAHMRACLQDLKGTRTLVVVGSYHCGGLFEGPAIRPPVTPPAAVSLLPYTFAQLDSRSGYGSGIRDPQWQQGVFDATNAEDIAEHTARIVTEVARHMRLKDTPAGTGEVAEAVRMAGDLARMRGLPATGRREAIEALTSVFAQGSVIGRGRAVAQALQAVMIGDRRGTLPPGAPVPALLSQVKQLLAQLRLPAGETDRSAIVRVEPFKGGRQLERHLALNRLQALNIPYVRERSLGQNRGLENRSYSAECNFSTGTAGALGVCIAGATLEQAVQNTIANRIVCWAGDADELLYLLDTSVSCALPEQVAACLDLVDLDLSARASFAAAVRATETLLGLSGGREPAAVLLPEALLERSTQVAETLSAAAVRELPGIAGSNELSDAALLSGVNGLVESHQVRATSLLKHIADAGSPLMRGAATAVLATMGSVEGISALVGSWIDQLASSADAARTLSGFLIASHGTWSESELFDGATSRVEQLSDAGFIQILPRLRAAFDPVPPAERERFLDHLSLRIGTIPPQAAHPDTLAANATADTAAAARLRALGLMDLALSPATRWRLALGAEPGALGAGAGRFAAALDELYGNPGLDPSGESDGRIGAGNEPGALSAREWTEEITMLFGDDHLQEIIGAAASMGRADVVENLSLDAVRPSVELLTTMLNLRGALPEARLRKIRPLIEKVVAELSALLARDLTPVLRGVTSTVPTRRRGPDIDLNATIRRNLRHVTMIGDTPRVVPVTPYFKSREVRTSPWHIIVVVDVSGSMEASTVYAAMTAAILTGIKTYEVSFLTFDTEVVDLSGHVEDPLQLLLEISVGGGTDIAKALFYAGNLVKVPSRTAIIVVSDFDEYGPVSRLVQQVRNLAESGVHLIGCAALDDTGAAVYNVGIAQAIAAAGMRVASLSPMQLARWVAEVLS